LLIQCRRRRFVAVWTKNSLLLKNNKRIYCSSIIQKYWRTYFCSRIFIDALIDVLLIQSLIRRWIATKYRKALQLEEPTCLALNDAQILWQSYFCSQIDASKHVIKSSQENSDRKFVDNYGTTFCSCSYPSCNANGLAEESHSLVKGCVRDDTLQEKRLRAALTILSFMKSICWKHLKIVRQQEVKKIRCAIFIQTIWRSYCCSISKFLTIRHVVAIQTTWRSYFFSLNYFAVLSATLLIQSSFRRCCSADLKLKLQLCRFQAVCATAIQSLWRSYDTSMTYLSVLSEIVFIQSIIRRKVAQRILNNNILLKSLESKLKEDSATKIQATWRCFSFSEIYLHFLSNLVIFQGVGRRFIACRILSSFLAQRKRLHESGAIAIQTLWRSYDTCLAYTGILSDIVMLQAMVRRQITQRKHNNSVLLISLQSNIERNFVTKIQAMWRSFRCSESYFHFQTNLVIFQGFCRKFLALRYFESLLSSRTQQLKTLCATVIQSTWRSYDTNMAYLSILNDIVMIQAIMRRRISRSRYESSSLYKSLQF